MIVSSQRWAQSGVTMRLHRDRAAMSTSQFLDSFFRFPFLKTLSYYCYLLFPVLFFFFIYLFIYIFAHHESVCVLHYIAHTWSLFICTFIHNREKKEKKLLLTCIYVHVYVGHHNGTFFFLLCISFSVRAHFLHSYYHKARHLKMLPCWVKKTLFRFLYLHHEKQISFLFLIHC